MLFFNLNPLTFNSLINSSAYDLITGAADVSHDLILATVACILKGRVSFFIPTGKSPSSIIDASFDDSPSSYPFIQITRGDFCCLATGL